MRDKPPLFRRLAWYRRRVEALEQQAVVDDLTGLRNQRALWRELSRRTRECSPIHPLAVVMLDFDLLEQVNEGYGHAVGDAVLRRGASVLRSVAPSPRLAFRYGGDELVLLIEGDAEDARGLAERLRAKISHQNGAFPAVTVSCGVTAFDGPVEPWQALDRADAALREAKRAGRNRVVIAGDDEAPARPHPMDEPEEETARRAAMALAMATLEVRDLDTAHHADDVLTLCEAIGRRLGFDGRELEHLHAGAQLHDVGKVAVPSSILNKPGPLNEDEWAVMREHTVIGERILRSVPEMAAVATIVRHCHENWDGTGYPDGLSGEQIPLASRIILCADAFHAIRCDRPYRDGRDAPDAIKELKACAGTQFDPAVVKALVTEAADARVAQAGGAADTRRKRLIVLLTTLVIGSGTAVAAIPEVRDAIRSVFGTTLAPSEAVSNESFTREFGFGPLGDLLSMERATPRRPERAEPKPAADRAPERRREPGSGPPPSSSPDGADDPTGAGDVRDTPKPRTPHTPPDSGSPTSPDPDGKSPNPDGKPTPPPNGAPAPPDDAPTAPVGSPHPEDDRSQQDDYADQEWDDDDDDDDDDTDDD